MKTILISVVLIFIFLNFSTAQKPDNNKPRYGEVKKSQYYINSDNEFIESVVKEFGTRDKAAKMASDLAWTHYEEGDLVTAMFRFNQAWLLDSTLAEVNWGFGRILADRKEFPEAIKYLTLYYKANPKNEKIIKDLAGCYLNYAYLLKKKDEGNDWIICLNVAKSYYKNYLSINSKDAAAYGQLAQAYYQENNIDSAKYYGMIAEKLDPKALRRDFKKAVGISQTNEIQQDTLNEALLRAQTLIKQGSPQEASKIYLNLMESHPDNKEAVRGWLMLNMKRTATGEEEAIKQLEELGKSYPRNTGIIFFKAFLEAEHNHNEEALKDIDKLIKLQPDTSLHYILKGQVLSAMKKYKEAFEAFDKATLLDPKRPDVWSMKAGTLAKTGKFDDALTSINKALELAPNYPVGIYNRACIYSLKGDRDNALADLKKAIGMNPSFKKSAVKDEDFKSLYDDEDFKKLTLILSIGQKAPDFNLNDVRGNPVSLSSKIGSKLLLIDFWAGWCAPCRQENPNVFKVYNEFKDKGFDIIGVSLDRTKDMWIQAINDDKLPWTQVSDLNYFNSAAAKLYEVASIPANFLLDEKGVIIAMNLRGEILYNRIKGILTQETVTDIDGNIYHTVTIGTQVWMVENLKTTKYRNGDPIPNITDSAEWRGVSTGVYCNYDNDIKNGDI